MSGKTSQYLLTLWHHVMLDNVHTQEASMTMRQMSVLMNVYLTSPPHTVRGLAAELRVTKPVITRALDTLGRLGYIKRKRDETDRRSVLVQRTVKGAVYLSELSNRIEEAKNALDNGDLEVATLELATAAE